MTVWTVRLSAAARADYQDILRWTTKNFGPAQARAYARTLDSALADLNAGPAPAGAKERPEIGAGIRTLHVSRRGRKGRHFILYRARKPNMIDVLDLLHDSMDLSRHFVSDDVH